LRDSINFFWRKIMNKSLFGVAVVCVAALAVAALLSINSVSVAHGDDEHMLGSPMAATGPSGMVCDMKTCQEHMANLDKAVKALDDAKKAADSGDAKTASTDIAMAQTILQDMQASMKKMMPSTAPAAAAGKVVNKTCPIMGSKIDPDNVPANLTRVYKDQTVGFCCTMCPPQWDKLSDAEKSTKLAAAMK